MWDSLNKGSGHSLMRVFLLIINSSVLDIIHEKKQFWSTENASENYFNCTLSTWWRRNATV